MALNESKIQAAFHKYMRLRYPDVMAFSVPNGAWLKGNYGMAMRLKSEGMMKGVPDYWIIGRSYTGMYAGLVIEFKAGTNKPSKEQKDYLEYLSANGFRAIVCYSANEAMYEVDQYFERL